MSLEKGTLPEPSGRESGSVVTLTSTAPTSCNALSSQTALTTSCPTRPAAPWTTHRLENTLSH